MKVVIDGVGFDPVTELEVVKEILSTPSGWLLTPNTDILRKMRDDSRLRELADAASLTVADGQPIVWAAALQGHRLPERVAGSTVMLSVLRQAHTVSKSLFLLGGNPGVADRVAQRLRADQPDVQLAGAYCPPFGFENDPREVAAVVEAVAASAPDVVMVGLSFPKQENIIRRLIEVHPQAWYLGIGAGLDFAAGSVRRAPGLVQRMGLEWAFRLVQEPGRLARRYLVDGIPYTVGLLVRSRRRRARPGRLVAEEDRRPGPDRI